MVRVVKSIDAPINIGRCMISSTSVVLDDEAMFCRIDVKAEPNKQQYRLSAIKDGCLEALAKKEAKLDELTNGGSGLTKPKGH
ncbi:hypothetical protein Tco_1540031 [Tanacetum coccineum]